MKIFIDCGHGYSVDTGAQGNGMKEQDLTYTIGHKVGDRLIRQGVEVKYSRYDITDNLGTTVNESLNNRCKMANDWNADYFVSIHCNASVNESANGTETFIYTRGGESERLATVVNERLSKYLTNRGVKVGNLAVLKNTNMPAILVETAFITNYMDSERLKRYEIPNAIADGILNFLGVDKMTAEQAIDKIIAKGTSIDKTYWLTACEHVKYLDALFIKIAEKM